MMEMENTLAYYDKATITALKKFYGTSPSSQSHKTFWSKYTYYFSKLDHFINVYSIFSEAKLSSLPKSVSKIWL